MIIKLENKKNILDDEKVSRLYLFGALLAKQIRTLNPVLPMTTKPCDFSQPMEILL